jgi:DNA-binding NarL/FixJ family response regulator
MVEDHALMSRGVETLLAGHPSLDFVGTVGTVAELPSVGNDLDLVILDLRLTDNSDPAANVAAIHRTGAHVLIYTGADDRRLIQSAARSGALGLVRKSADPDDLLQAIVTAAEGHEVFGTDWAAAIDADSSLSDAGLSAREQEILSMYASGETAISVARATGLSRETVADYVSRIRRKYAHAGRPAQSRVDLYKRALEDGLLEAPE